MIFTLFMFICAFCTTSPIYSMLKRPVRYPVARTTVGSIPRGVKHSAYLQTQQWQRAKGLGVRVQKRALYTPTKLKGLYELLTQEAQPVSPVHGAALYSSGALQQVYNTESDRPAVKLVQELFYQQSPGEAIKPTVSRSKAAYSFAPGITGLVLGALETNQLNDAKTRTFIVDTWRSEHKKITDGSKLGLKKVTDLLDLIQTVYNNDKNQCRGILLTFLYAKADPQNNHDMIHYFAGLNMFMPIFQQKPGFQQVTPKKDVGFMEQIAALFNYIKDYISGEYTAEEVKKTYTALVQMKPSEATHYALGKGFEQTVGTLLMQKQSTVPYPPKIIQGHHRFKTNEPVADCAETAFREILNCLVYNYQTQTFDLSLLPANTHPIPALINFYTQHPNPHTVNAHSAGQDFMNLVSGVNGVVYVQKENKPIKEQYEIEPADTLQNTPALFNYLLGIKTHNLKELGAALSDNRRTVTLQAQDLDKHTNKIIIQLVSHVTHIVQTIELCFNNGHGWVEIPERDKKNVQNLLLEPETLASQYSLNQKAQTLFNLQQDIAKLPKEAPASLYYTLPAENDPRKVQIISKILRQSPHNLEATDYAYTLYKQLPASTQINLLDLIKHSKVLDFNEKFKNIYTIIKPENKHQSMYLINIILSNWPNDPNALDSVETLITTVGQNNISLTYAIENKNINLARFLLQKGANVNKKQSGFTPLHLAITANNADMVELLLKHNANIDAVDIRGMTPLDYALGANQKIKQLLEDTAQKAGISTKLLPKIKKTSSERE